MNKRGSKVLSVEQPPIPQEVAQKMRDLLTDAMRLYADALGLQHDVENYQTAAFVDRRWWKIELEGGLVRLHIEGEVLLGLPDQPILGGSHIVYARPVEFTPPADEGDNDDE